MAKLKAQVIWSTQVVINIGYFSVKLNGIEHEDQKVPSLHLLSCLL